MGDERDLEIADLKAEVDRLSRALEEARPEDDELDLPPFTHGVRGLFGFVQLIIGAFLLLILLKVVHHLAR